MKVHGFDFLLLKFLIGSVPLWTGVKLNNKFAWTNFPECSTVQRSVWTVWHTCFTTKTPKCRTKSEVFQFRDRTKAARTPHRVIASCSWPGECGVGESRVKGWVLGKGGSPTQQWRHVYDSTRLFLLSASRGPMKKKLISENHNFDWTGRNCWDSCFCSFCLSYSETTSCHPLQRKKGPNISQLK